MPQHNPSRGRALLFIINLSLVNFLEWPIILGRGPIQSLPVTIIARTLILLLLAFTT